MSEDKKTIGLVDDHGDTRIIGNAILSTKGYKVILGKTGQEAIDIINQYPNLSALIIDNEMPVMNGLEAIKKIRETNKDLPILMVSGSDVKMEASVYGVTDYLSKPYRKDDLVAKVDELTQ